MIRIYRGQNWIIREKPSGLCIREKLSNGQYLNMWFWRKRAAAAHAPILYVWTVGLYIGGKKDAAHWRRCKAKTKQTGDCGLEGLKIALENIKTFTSRMGYREELQIGHEDMKRHRAYKFLLRYPEFAEYTFADSKPCIAFRITDYWEWNPKKREGKG
jgi:hypothetical protein